MNFNDKAIEAILPTVPLIDSQTMQVDQVWLYFFDNIGRVVDEAITANLPKMNSDILDSTNNITTNKQSITDANNKLGVANNRIDTTNTNLTDLQNTMEQSDIVLSMRASAVESDISDLQNEVDTNTSAINAIDLSVLQAEIDDIKQRLTTAGI